MHSAPITQSPRHHQRYDRDSRASDHTDAHGRSAAAARQPQGRPRIEPSPSGVGVGRRTRFSFTALTDFAVELSGVAGRSPRMCVLATAMGDDKAVLHYLTEAAQERLLDVMPA